MGLLNWNFMQQNPELVRMASNGFNHAGNSLNQFSSKLLKLDQHNQALKESNAGIAYQKALTEGVNKQNSWVDKKNQASIMNMNANTANINASTNQTEIQNKFLPDYLAKKNEALGLQNRHQWLIKYFNEGTLNNRIAAENVAMQARATQAYNAMGELGVIDPAIAQYALNNGLSAQDAVFLNTAKLFPQGNPQAFTPQHSQSQKPFMIDKISSQEQTPPLDLMIDKVDSAQALSQAYTQSTIKDKFKSVIDRIDQPTYPLTQTSQSPNIPNDSYVQLVKKQREAEAQAQKEAQKQKARLEFLKLSPEQRVLSLNSIAPIEELGLKESELGWAYDVLLDDGAIIRTTEGGSAFRSPFPYNQKATNEIIKFYRNSPLHNMQKARDLDILKYHYELVQERGLQ